MLVGSWYIMYCKVAPISSHLTAYFEPNIKQYTILLYITSEQFACHSKEKSADAILKAAFEKTTVFSIKTERCGQCLSPSLYIWDTCGVKEHILYKPPDAHRE